MECELLGNFLSTWPRRICLSSTCPEIPVESCFFDPSLFEVIRVFQPCACTWWCNTKTSASSVLLTVFAVLCCVFFVTAVHALALHLDTCALRMAQVRAEKGSPSSWLRSFRLNARDLCVATSVEQVHQRLGIAEGVIHELQEQLQRVSAGHQAMHQELLNAFRSQADTRSRVRLVEPKNLMPDQFGKRNGPLW